MHVGWRFVRLQRKINGAALGGVSQLGKSPTVLFAGGQIASGARLCLQALRN